ncbi:hypothetical protein Gotri_013148 [Gossypium trilobum]|uniref:Uncharacterized protein n=1 Tax=Gossypium trilobum TaxID=34281 RepID=A0A7J9DSM1_9ROSI|nr:hypothetical protein [Gossypium trilobum]
MVLDLVLRHEKALQVIKISIMAVVPLFAVENEIIYMERNTEVMSNWNLMDEVQLNFISTLHDDLLILKSLTTIVPIQVQSLGKLLFMIEREKGEGSKGERNKSLENDAYFILACKFSSEKQNSRKKKDVKGYTYGSALWVNPTTRVSIDGIEEEALRLGINNTKTLLLIIPFLYRDRN